MLRKIPAPVMPAAAGSRPFWKLPAAESDTAGQNSRNIEKSHHVKVDIK